MGLLLHLGVHLLVICSRLQGKRGLLKRIFLLPHPDDTNDLSMAIADAYCTISTFAESVCCNTQERGAYGSRHLRRGGGLGSDGST